MPIRPDAVDDVNRTSCLLRVLTAGALAVAGTLGGLAVAVPAHAAGSVVYVSTAGSDHTGCGSSTDNRCATIQYGIDQANPGDTVQVAAGTYNEVLDIEKAVTVQGAGAGTTVIDGTGKDQPGTSTFGQKYGVVYVGATGGAAKVDGFTIENPIPFPGADGAPDSVVLQDPNGADSVTISNNTILGNAANTDPGAGQVGVYSFHNSATLSISSNDISGVFQGVLLESVGGPASVAGNTIHGLSTFTDGANVYGGEGVFLLSDLSTPQSGQSVTGNTFSGYGGIGVAASAGYDNGDCSTTVCHGFLSATVTGNTFTLGATPGNQPAGAFRLNSKAGNQLSLTTGGNTGTVVAPTQPIVEATAAGGTIAVSPTATPNTITTNPAPTLGVAVPSSITTDENPTAFTGTATNNSGESLPNVRYDIKITGTSGIAASDIKLQYSTDNGGTYLDVPLTGTASSGTAITGYFGPVGGFSLPDGVSLTTPFKISVLSATAPAGTLSATVSLDQLNNAGTQHPAINTLASTTSNTAIVDNSAPTAPNQTVTTRLNTPVAVTLHGADVDGDAVSYQVTAPEHGTLSGTAPNLTFTPATGFVGSTSFAYTVSDGKAGSNTGTVTIVVSPASTTLTATLAPKTGYTTGTSGTLTVAVTANPASATVNGGTVSLTAQGSGGTSFARSGVVTGGKVVFALPKLPAGTERFDVSYSGTATAGSQHVSVSVTVAKTTPTLTVTTSPANPKSSQTKTTKVTATLAAGGADPDGALARLYFGDDVLSQGTVSGGKVTFTIGQTLSPGTHLFQFRYAGTATVNKLIKGFRITVAAG